MHATNLFVYGFLALHIWNKHESAHTMNTLAFIGLVADMAYNQFMIKDLENELGHGAGGPWFLSLSFIVFFGISKAFVPVVATILSNATETIVSNATETILSNVSEAATVAATILSNETTAAGN
jgi:hypothetical protein